MQAWAKAEIKDADGNVIKESWKIAGKDGKVYKVSAGGLTRSIRAHWIPINGEANPSDSAYVQYKDRDYGVTTKAFKVTLKDGDTLWLPDTQHFRNEVAKLSKGKDPEIVDVDNATVDFGKEQ